MVAILRLSGVAVALCEKRLLAQDVPGGVVEAVWKPLGAVVPVRGALTEPSKATHTRCCRSIGSCWPGEGIRAIFCAPFL
jgi:hypothetical protein